MPFPILAAAMAAQGIASVMRGMKQRQEANRIIQKNSFPNQNIPQAALDALRQAELDANTGLPREQYAQAEQAIARNTNNALRQGQDRRTGQANIGAIQQASNDANLSLNVASAKQRIANRMILLNQKNNMANWQNQIFDWNQRQKYLQNAASARALLGASQQNYNNAIDSTISSALIYGSNNSDLDKGDKVKKVKKVKIAWSQNDM